ncbi:hypothetical protein ACFS4T_26590 [Pseudomonas lini]
MVTRREADIAAQRRDLAARLAGRGVLIGFFLLDDPCRTLPPGAYFTDFFYCRIFELEVSVFFSASDL